MPSKRYVSVSPRVASPLEVWSGFLGTFTANTTVTPGVRFGPGMRVAVDKVVFVADAVPADADGAMTINVKEGTNLWVNAFNAESMTTAGRPYAASLAPGVGTLGPLQSLRFELVNNSAAIDTNANITVFVYYRLLE